jgi:hypothetical protein
MGSKITFLKQILVGLIQTIAYFMIPTILKPEPEEYPTTSRIRLSLIGNEVLRVMELQSAIGQK